ncbi:MAG: alpha-amylase [Epulopiscium sp.]|nr:alpha-amylase [Candidatus Epulonipiscium sp.]
MKNKVLKRFIAYTLIAFSIFFTLPAIDYGFNDAPIAYAAGQYNLPLKTEDGVMLHAYMWRFKDIKNMLPEIAQAGYNSIQVSPVQGTKGTGQWWLLYQPTNFHIGNAQLGSYNDFKDLCNEAKKYGIDIIVDVVLNHVAEGNSPGQWSDAVAAELKRHELYHNRGAIGNYKDREQVTQQNLGGLPDLATQRQDVQDMHIAFLNECIDAGAGGFRFDAAKHIETNKYEDAGKPWQGNYWDRVLGSIRNKDSLYLVGEVLPDSGDNYQAYLTYFDITAHGYGGSLRNAVTSKNLTGLGTINHGNHTLPANKSFVYVENHDDYEHNVSRSLGQWERKMAFAVAAARAEVTPRFLARPLEALWKDADVVAVNKFRNAMVGKDEYLRWTRNETMIIERGNAGMVIVNVGGNAYIDSPTRLKDGVYTNKATGNATLQVTNGKVRGDIPGGSIIVLYNENGSGNDGDNSGDDKEPTILGDTVAINPATPIIGQSFTLTYNAKNRPLHGASIVKAHWGYDGWKGVTQTNMISKGNNIWEVTLNVPTQAQNKIDIVFTDGSRWDNNDSKDWSIGVKEDEGGGEVEDPIVIPTKTLSYNVEGNTIKVIYYAKDRPLHGASIVKAHWGYDGWKGITQTSMTSKGENIWEVILNIPSQAQNKIDIVFTDGSKWDNNNNKDWSIKTEKDNGEGPIIPTETFGYKTEGNTIKITYYAKDRPLHGTSVVKAYWGYDNWNGISETNMISKGNNIWEVTLQIPAQARNKIDIVFNDGSRWDNNNNRDWAIQIR